MLQLTDALVLVCKTPSIYVETPLSYFHRERSKRTCLVLARRDHTRNDHVPNRGGGCRWRGFSTRNSTAKHTFQGRCMPSSSSGTSDPEATTPPASYRSAQGRFRDPAVRRRCRDWRQPQLARRLLVDE